MACLGHIKGGSDLARADLLFLTDLLFQLGCRVEVLANLPRTLGFTDVYRSPALGAEDFISVDKASEGLLEALSTLRVLTLERVRKLVEVAGHDALPEKDKQPYHAPHSTSST